MPEGKPETDAYGQLAIGYELSRARAWVLEHAERNLPARYAWLQGLDLAWEITTARFMEDQDCYEVLVSCYPEGAEVQTKGEWLYHVDVRGQLMPGTPVLRQAGKWEASPLEAAKAQIVEGLLRLIRAAKKLVAEGLARTSAAQPLVEGLLRLIRTAKKLMAEGLARTSATQPQYTPTVVPPAPAEAPVPSVPPVETPAPVPQTAVERMPEPVARVLPELKYAGFRVRLLATIVDNVLLAVLSLILTPLLGKSSSAGDLVLFNVVYSAWMLAFWVWRGQTPGKMLLRVKIVAADGTKLSPGRAALRYLVGYTLSGLTLGVGYLLIAFDKERRGLHDRVAGTRVVKVHQHLGAHSAYYG